ncbi:hypothetical protein OM075_24525, partial [Marinilabiliaceae bacterium AAT]|nr:hypothetical protein [Plebeiobacterium sediminum]
MLKFIFRPIVALMVITFLFTACNKEIDLEDSETTTTNSELNNIPQFSSLADFNNSVNNFYNNNVVPSEMKGIISLNSYNSLKSVSEEEIEEDTIVDSDLLCNFLNIDHEIIVGDVLFKITEKGTFFTDIENADYLFASLNDENILDQYTSISSALGYDSDLNDLYSIDKYENIYFFDTFRKLTTEDQAPIEQVSTSLKAVRGRSGNPEEEDWKYYDIPGKTGSKLWGFKFEDHPKFDSRHRLNAKFYALNYGILREMGIKCKVQKKGWTGIWHKIESQRLINGWEVLNFKETWKYNYFGPDFNPNKNNLPDFRCYPETWKDLDYTTSNYLKEDWITFNIMGADLDFSQKDKVTGLWHAAKNAGKMTVDYLNNHFTESPNNQLEAIRIAPNN